MTTPFEALDEAARTAHLRDVAARALPAWGLPADTPLTLLNISENATWRVDVAGEPAPRILRVHRTGYHSTAGVASELAWTQALQAEAGIPTPQAMAATDGSLIQCVATPALDEDRMVVSGGSLPIADQIIVRDALGARSAGGFIDAPFGSEASARSQKASNTPG